MQSVSATEGALPLSAYVAIGPRFVTFALDPVTGDMAKRGEIRLPSRVQYVWAHPVLPILYAGCADRSPEGQSFQLCLLHRDPQGDLTSTGTPFDLPARPIQLTVDAAGKRLFIAYNAAPGLSVHHLNDDGTVGQEIPRAEGYDMGVSPHQVRVCPGGQRAILVARGTKGHGTAKHVQGGLNVLRMDRGCVENAYSVVPGADQAPGGFNPRNVEFHPTLPLAYVTLEEQNALAGFAMQGDEILPDLLFAPGTLADPAGVKPRQDCGSVRLHPSGRFAYVANRNDGYLGDQKGRPTWISPDPVPEFPGGENNIAVFELDDAGVPRRIQNIGSGGLHPRTIMLDRSGQILIAGNIAPTVMEQDGAQAAIPANVTVFRVGADGRLTRLATHAIDVGSEMVWWVGIVG